MNSSPMEIAGDLSDPKNCASRQQLAYVAQLFRGSLLAYPNAVLIVTGPNDYCKSIEGYLTKQLQVALAKIRSGPAIPIVSPIPLPPSPYGTPSPMFQKPEERRASIRIEYGPPVRKLKVTFAPDPPRQSFEIEFEEYPDGRLKVVQGKWETTLKKMITDSKQMGIRQVKIGMKIAGQVDLDRNSLQKIETAVKNKLEAFSTLAMQTPVGMLMLKFYWTFGLKQSNGKNKEYQEFRLLFEIRF